MGNARNIAFWVVLFLLILALFQLFSGSGGTLQAQRVGYSDFVSAVDSQTVNSVVIDGEQVRYRTEDGRDFVTIMPSDAAINRMGRWVGPEPIGLQQ